MYKIYKKQMKTNGPRTGRNQDNGGNFWQRVKHARLYSDPQQASNDRRTHADSGFSGQRTAAACGGEQYVPVAGLEQDAEPDVTVPQALARHEHRLIQTLLVNLLWNHGRHLHAQVTRAVLHADPVVVHAVPATARVDVLDEHLLQKPATWTFLMSESESLLYQYKFPGKLVSRAH